MKSAITAVPCALFLLAGCGQPTAPTTIPNKPPVTKLVQPIAPTAAVAPVTRIPWTKSIVNGGFMFQDEKAFRAYLGRSDIAVIGTVTSWESYQGKLHVERVLRGPAGPELDLLGSGGFLSSKSGQRVIALLSTDRGKMKLHSFCAASGLYPYTQPLAEYVEGALQFRLH